MPVEDLFKKINIENNTFLNYNNYDVTLPSEVNDDEGNTSVVINPKDNRRKEKAINYIYNRIELEEIFTNNDHIEFLVDNETDLYSYLPKINEKLGTNLTEEDIVNSTIDPTIPDSVRVEIPVIAKPESYMYKGYGTLILGTAHVVPDVVKETYKRVLVINDTLSLEDTIRSYDNTSLLSTDPFVFLSNCQNITSKIIEEAFVSNNRIVLIGDFSLSAYMSYGLISIVNAGTIYLDHTGRLVDWEQSKLSDNDTLVYNEKYEFLYRYEVNGSTTNFVKMNYKGGLFPGWNLTVNFPVEQCYVDTEGNLYLITEKYNNGTRVVLNIHKYKPDGIIDSIWNVVEISSSIYTTDTHGVYNISITENYVDIYIEPQINVSQNDSLPVINGVLYINPKPTARPEFGWLPIVRLLKDGTVDSSFDPVTETENFESIWLDPPVAFNIPNAMVSNDKEINIISYSRIHPGGWENYRILPVSNRGHISHKWWNEKREMPVWAGITDVYHTTDGHTFISGLAKIPEGGVLTNDKAVVVGFNRNSFTTTYVTETDPNLIGHKLLVLEY
jgi:hypothetical protein